MLANEYCNVYSDSITTNMDTNRNCIRRITCHDENEFSAQSILHAMEKFVKAVNDMDETILIPCRLMDMKVTDEDTGKEPAKSSPEHHQRRRLTKELTNTDLYSVYAMINGAKNELLWGQNKGASYPEVSEVTTHISSSSSSSTVDDASSTTSSTQQIKGHIRRPSTVSVASTNSTSSAASSTCDTDSETGNENDSGVEGETEDYSQAVSDKFRRHLNGMYHCLDHMTEAAAYLTARYQSDIGGAV